MEDRRVSKGQPQSIDVIVTKTSGKLRILSWINGFLTLQDEAPVSEDQPAVDAIHRWVETEYANGREESISEEEMVIQGMTRLGSNE